MFVVEQGEYSTVIATCRSPESASELQELVTDIRGS